MEGMRSLLRNSMARSLHALPPEDKLAAAWPVACGKAMAERGAVVGYQEGEVWLEVQEGAWLKQMMSMQGQLAGQMSRIAGVTVSRIHFKVKRK
ncbi:MAG: hypothetical protein BGO25_12220 [Acidobacteriales bacterium 59-55]|nr:DUF721 domain-containing protein [Terriglobales bacterium]OJV43900.1 MAG: hypothetical protein BGO25_12220 [Acidobacteriales bacterium 59-55]